MSSSLRLAVCERLAAIEFEPRALLPVFVVETPYEGNEPGWALRIAELEEDYEAVRAAVDEDPESANLAPLAPLPTDRGATLDAVEAFRMCGQLALRDGDETNAVTALVRALRSAAADEPIGAPSAPLAARMLADVYRRWGQRVQADSLEEEARRLEGTDGGAR